jgi:phosphoribosylformylglycinamidine synthase
VHRDDLDTVLEKAQQAGVVARAVGKTGGAALTLPGCDAISLIELTEIHERWLPDYMKAR